MTVLIDYKAGNLASVRLAFEALGAPVRVASTPDGLRGARRLVFPGVGAAGAAMAHLRAAGLDAAVKAGIAEGVPFLGICLGTQILFERSEEDGGVAALGILPGAAVKFPSAGAPGCKIPHIGWNQTRAARAHPLFEGVPDGEDFYFVHSYHPAPRDGEAVIRRTEYCGVDFASAVGRGNVVATQFHPEKSGPAGLRVLRNFLEWAPAAAHECGGRAI